MKVALKHTAVLIAGMLFNSISILFMGLLLSSESVFWGYVVVLAFPTILMGFMSVVLLPRTWKRVPKVNVDESGVETEDSELEDLVLDESGLEYSEAEIDLDEPNDGFAETYEESVQLSHVFVSTVIASVIGMISLYVLTQGNTGVNNLSGLEAVMWMYLPYGIPFVYVLYKTLTFGKLKGDTQWELTYAGTVFFSILGVTFTTSFYTDTFITGAVFMILSYVLNHKLSKQVENTQDDNQKELTKESDLA